MNKRIVELAAHAGLETHNGTEISPAEILFAELVILECCRMANERIQYNNSNDSLLVLDIKEYFGVE